MGGLYSITISTLSPYLCSSHYNILYPSNMLPISPPLFTTGNDLFVIDFHGIHPPHMSFTVAILLYQHIYPIIVLYIIFNPPSPFPLHHINTFAIIDDNYTLYIPIIHISLRSSCLPCHLPLYHSVSLSHLSIQLYSLYYHHGSFLSHSLPPIHPPSTSKSITITIYHIYNGFFRPR